ncbi:MAG: hypothetical protein ACPGU7_13860 [Gammaproteobacteria bacterium]
MPHEPMTPEIKPEFPDKVAIDPDRFLDFYLSWCDRSLFRQAGGQSADTGVSPLQAHEVLRAADKAKRSFADAVYGTKVLGGSGSEDPVSRLDTLKALASGQVGKRQFALAVSEVFDCDLADLALVECDGDALRKLMEASPRFAAIKDEASWQWFLEARKDSPADAWDAETEEREASVHELIDLEMDFAYEFKADRFLRLDSKAKACARGWGIRDALLGKPMKPEHLDWIAERLNVALVDLTPYRGDAQRAQRLAFKLDGRQRANRAVKSALGLRLARLFNEHVGLEAVLRRVSGQAGIPERLDDEPLASQLARLTPERLTPARFVELIWRSYRFFLERNPREFEEEHLDSAAGLRKLARVLLPWALPRRDEVIALINHGRSSESPRYSLPTRLPGETAIALAEASGEEPDILPGAEDLTVRSPRDVTPDWSQGGFEAAEGDQQALDMRRKVGISADPGDFEDDPGFLAALFRNIDLSAFPEAAFIDSPEERLRYIRDEIADQMIDPKARPYFAAMANWDALGEAVETALRKVVPRIELIETTGRRDADDLRPLRRLLKIINWGFDAPKADADHE